MPHRHEIRIRYGEVDQQGVVFNAHYLAYLDDAMDTWLRSLGRFEDLGWDLVLKRAELVWEGSAGVGDVLTIDLAVTRWGTTSFDVSGTARVEDRLVVRSTITYVGVRPGTAETIPPPSDVRNLLGDS